MKLYYIGILRPDPRPAVELAVAKNLSDFSRFTSNSYGSFMSVFAKTIAERIKPDREPRLEVTERGYKFHAYASTLGVVAILIADDEYPRLFAQQVLSKAMDEFTANNSVSSYAIKDKDHLPPVQKPQLETYLKEYQDPKNADSIMKIQRELDDTKIVLRQTIESVLERGEKLDNLVEKSEGLTAQSRMFYQQAKKQNSCCIVM